MEDINPKIEDSGATADGRLSADEYNDRNEELENAVTRSGQALAPANPLQLSESLFLNSTKAVSFQDAGVLNAVDLRPLSGAAGVKIPTAYTNMDGVIVSFKPAVNNTGATTLNIGQTAGIGAKPLVLSTDFSALIGGELDITLYAQAQYDLGGDRWLLLPWALPAAVVTFPILVSQGGTGAGNAAGARTNLDVPPNARDLTTSGLLTGGGTLASDRNFDVLASSQGQAEAGTDNATSMTPLRVAQAIAALGGGGFKSIQVFSSSGAATWNRPAGITSVLILCTGGGGGGGGWTGLSSVGGGGGSGATVSTRYDVSAAASLALVVGAAGTQGTGSTGNGGNGGSSTVIDGATTIANAGGGNGGIAGTQILVSNQIQVQDYVLGGVAGIAVVGDVLADGAAGRLGSLNTYNTALTIDTTTSNPTQPVNYGNGLRAYGMGGSGAASYWGGGAPDTAAGYNGTAFFAQPSVTPVSPGSGGAGGVVVALVPGSAPATAGASGIIMILEFV